MEATMLEQLSSVNWYPDGTTSSAYAFDIPVPVIGEEYDCALIGKKGKWYDYKVLVADTVPVENQN
jgi:hypothetical protein